MKTLRMLAIAGLVGLGTLAVTNESSAQYYGSTLRRLPSTYFPQSFPWRFNNGVIINPNYRVAPGLTINQAAYNTAVLGSAYNYVPPYALGYNPYMTSLYSGNYYPTYVPSTYYVPYYNPYAAMSNPYGTYLSPYGLYP